MILHLFCLLSLVLSPATRAESASNHGPSLSEAINGSQDPFKPIGFKCPDENGGILEEFRENKAGLKTWARYYYRNGSIVLIRLDAAWPGKRFESIREYDLGKSQDPEALASSQKAAAQVNAVNANVCHGGPETRSRFNAMLASNVKELRANKR